MTVSRPLVLRLCERAWQNPVSAAMCSAAILFAFGDHPEATAQAAAVYIPSRSAHVTFFKVENAYEKPGMS